ncbi:MAG: MaoC family dehydratase [Methyloligellaceae bacterium]
MDYVIPSRFDPQVSSYSIHTLHPGLTASDVRRVLHTDISRYVALSRDRNPIHSNPEYAQRTLFGQEIALGLLPEGILSSLLGTKLPGQGAIYVSKTVSFRAPVNPGDQLTTLVRIEDVDRERRLITLAGDCSNQDQTIVAQYQVKLMLDKGQELEFLCDLFKLAAERDPFDPKRRQDLIDAGSLDIDAQIGAYARLFDWEACPDLFSTATKLMAQADDARQLREQASKLADPNCAIEHLSDALIWWSTAPSLFSKLTNEFGHAPEAAWAKILEWSSAMGDGDKRISLPGLERLSDVDLSDGKFLFDAMSKNELASDTIECLGAYIARKLR